MDFIAYLNAVRKHWWPLMSCALFTCLGIWILYADKSNAWSIRATFALAGFCLFIACYLAWLDEHKRVAAVKDEKEQLGRKHFDERPLIGIETHSVEGIQTWREHPAPIAFSIHHLSGRVPTAIRFDPILSLSGNFVLHFDAIPHIEKNGRGIEFRVERVGDPRYSAHDLELFKKMQVEMLRHFLDDSPIEQIELKYGLVVHFKDRGEDLTQLFQLVFNKERFLFLPNTAI